MGKYIEFKVIDKKPKTYIISVIEIRTKETLGMIKWYGPWRQYIFEPLHDTFYSWDCLETISNYIKKLMDERRGNKK